MCGGAAVAVLTLCWLWTRYCLCLTLSWSVAESEMASHVARDGLPTRQLRPDQRTSLCASMSCGPGCFAWWRLLEPAMLRCSVTAIASARIS